MYDLNFLLYAYGSENIQIKGNPNLSNIDFAALENIGDLYIAGNGKASGPVTSLNLGKLSEGESIFISDVGSVNMSHIFSVSGDLTFSSNYFDKIGRAHV